jgi:hypothetical protein
MNLLAAIFLQITIIRGAVGLALTLAFVLTLSTAGGGPFSSKRERYNDPGIARASDEWRAAPKRATPVTAGSEEAIEAAITECMSTWEATPLEPHDHFNRPVDTSSAAREAMRPTAEARCRRSVRYKLR